MTMLKELNLGAVPGEVVEVYHGDTLRVHATYYYKGPAVKKKFRAAIGEQEDPESAFDENLHKEFEFPQQASAGQDFNIHADILIATSIGDGTYHLYCKINGIWPDAESEVVWNCIRVVVAKEFRNLRIVSFEKV